MWKGKMLWQEYGHECACMFLLYCDGSQLTSGIKGLQTALASGYTHKG